MVFESVTYLVTPFFYLEPSPGVADQHLYSVEVVDQRQELVQEEPVWLLSAIRLYHERSVDLYLMAALDPEIGLISNSIVGKGKWQKTERGDGPLFDLFSELF